MVSPYILSKKLTTFSGHRPPKVMTFLLMVTSLNSAAKIVHFHQDVTPPLDGVTRGGAASDATGHCES